LEKIFGSKVRAAGLINAAADRELALLPVAIVVGLAAFAAAGFVLRTACLVRLLARALRLIAVAASSRTW